MAAKRWLLFVRPVKPPRWWPRAPREAAWCGVLRGGAGWVFNVGDPLTRVQIDTARAELQQWDHGRAEFKEVAYEAR